MAEVRSRLGTLFAQVVGVAVEGDRMCPPRPPDMRCIVPLALES